MINIESLLTKPLIKSKLETITEELSSPSFVGMIEAKVHKWKVGIEVDDDDQITSKKIVLKSPEAVDPLGNDFKIELSKMSKRL